MTKSRFKIRSLPIASCLVAGLALFLADAGLADMDRDFQKPKIPSRVSSGGSSNKGASPPARNGGSRGTATRSHGPRSGNSGGRSGANPRSGRRTSGQAGTHGSGHRSYDHGGSRGSYRHRGRHGNYGSHHRHYSGCGHYGYSHYGSYNGYWGGIGFYPYYGYYGYGWWPSANVYRHRPYYASNGRNLGGLDLDVRPEKAEVYVNGRYAGVADEFDGFPAYLWLEEGSYEISFYKDGFETLTREIAVTPTAVVDIGDRLVPGEAVKPEPIPESSTAAQAKSDWARKEDQWRQRAREYRSQRQGNRDSQRENGAEVFDTRGEPGRLQLTVAPQDASVYLDGRLLGSAGELDRLHSGLIVSPGDHGLEVVRPGYESRSVTFSVEEGKEVEVDVQLEAATGEA